MDNLLVEDLPGEHAGLVQDLAAVFCVGIAVEVEAFVEEALAPGIDDDPERVVVLLETVADIEVAKGRGVHIPGDGMRARPVPGDCGAEVERHLQALPGVEARAAHLGEVPVRPEIACPHLGIGLETAAGEDHRLGAQLANAALMAHAHPLDAVVALQEADRRRLIKNRNPLLRGARCAAPSSAPCRRPRYGRRAHPRT